MRSSTLTRSTSSNQSLSAHSTQVGQDIPATEHPAAASTDSPRARGVQHLTSMGEVPATQEGQHQQVLVQLQAWGHSPTQAEQIAAQPGYLRCHTQLFALFEHPPHTLKPGSVLSEQDQAQLFTVCQVWLVHGNGVACGQLLPLALSQKAMPMDLWHAMLSLLPTELLKPLTADKALPLLKDLPTVGGTDSTNATDADAVPCDPREQLQWLLGSTDPTVRARLQLFWAQQRKSVPGPIGPDTVALHLQQLSQAYPLLCEADQARLVRCATKIMRRCDSETPQARFESLRRQCQRLRDPHALRVHNQMMSGLPSWLCVTIAPPPEAQGPFQLQALHFDPQGLRTATPEVVQAAQAQFSRWVHMQATASSGLSTSALYKIVEQVAGTLPDSLAWSTPSVELQRFTAAASEKKLPAVNEAQLDTLLALCGRPEISEAVRFRFLAALCSLLPPCDAQHAGMHRKWLRATLSPNARMRNHFSYTLLEQTYRHAHPGALDDKTTRELCEDLIGLWPESLTRPARQRFFEDLQASYATHRPTASTPWNTWRVLASHWLYELCVRQDRTVPAHWNHLIHQIQQAAAADEQRPHEWVSRLTELLGDLVDLLPTQDRLPWLHALQTACRQQVADTDPTSPALMGLATLCGATRELIGLHGGAVPADPSATFEREVELLRQWSRVVRRQEQGDHTQARHLAAAAIQVRREQAAHRPHAQALDPVFRGLAQTHSPQ